MLSKVNTYCRHQCVRSNTVTRLYDRYIEICNVTVMSSKEFWVNIKGFPDVFVYRDELRVETDQLLMNQCICLNLSDKINTQSLLSPDFWCVFDVTR